MKSVKPGRGPSMMEGISCLLVGLFGICWTVVAATMGGGFFAIFGVIFVLIAVVQAVYHFKNATGENRYSSFDITDGEEEPDPFNERFGRTARDTGGPGDYGSGSVGGRKGEPEKRFCPYCGTKIEGDYVYCPRCGKKLP